jgi:hypothetical protein
MKSEIERVNSICQYVRKSQLKDSNFKNLISSIKKQFKIKEIDLILKTKKDYSLEKNNFFITAYYDPEDDRLNEIPIEIIINHNFNKIDQFRYDQITDFLIEIFDAVIHELKHQSQSKKRNFRNFNVKNRYYNKYLSDPDELDAYALSITIELCRILNPVRIKKYMSKISVLSRMKIGSNLISPNLKTYIDQFNGDPILKKLSKKIAKNLDLVDNTQIFR